MANIIHTVLARPSERPRNFVKKYVIPPPVSRLFIVVQRQSAEQSQNLLDAETLSSVPVVFLFFIFLPSFSEYFVGAVDYSVGSVRILCYPRQLCVSPLIKPEVGSDPTKFQLIMAGIGILAFVIIFTSTFFYK